MPEISIIVPVYNVEKYLIPCIDSILAQSFPDFELILVDDGSTDSCPDICDEYAMLDNRITVFHQKNQGQSVARNVGITKARGKWICFIDSDDIAHPQMLELLQRAIQDTGARISMCSAVEDDTPPRCFTAEANASYSAHIVDETYLLNLFENKAYRPWTVWAKLIDREILVKYSFAPGKFFEDNAVVCKWLMEAETVCDTDACLYFYRVNPNGTTKSAFNINMVDQLWALRELTDFFDSTGCEKLKSRFCSAYMCVAPEYYWRVLRELNLAETAEDIRCQMRKMIRKNRSFITLSKQQKLSAYDVMYPRRMQLYWLAQAGLTEWKNHGFFGFFRKAISHIVKKGKRV